MTQQHIRSLIEAGESFWVATETERVYACREIAHAGTSHRTWSDEKGGFYIVKITLPKRTTNQTKCNRKP